MPSAFDLYADVPTGKLALFEHWQYQDPRANCSEYVKAWLLRFTPLVAADYPLGLVSSTAARAKHAGYRSMRESYQQLEQPVNHCLAAQFDRGVFVHVGVVYQGRVWHTGQTMGTSPREPLSLFEARAAKTEYLLHNKLAEYL